MSHSKNKLLTEGYRGDYVGSIMGVIQGDTRSLDYSSNEVPMLGKHY